ncbi:hypothetical protein LIER_02092 [Lithospermum erythrorhizon]|uniref:Uncharacterized protein n=1 Tax=Lithospermum erythrorhizon TaxID=34254 RepID=A0AAV3NN95_LITER
MLVDTGSSTNILYLRAYARFGLPHNLLKVACTPLTGFMWHSIYPVGIAELDFTVEEALRTSTIRVSFTVVDISYPSYNRLIRPIITSLRAKVLLLHLKKKFPTTGGVGEVSGDQKRSTVYYQFQSQEGHR